MTGVVGDGSWSLWEIGVSLISSGALTSAIGLIFVMGRRSGQMDELEKRISEQEGELTGFIDKSDKRHESNIDAINRVTNAVAAVPSKADFQRLEDQIGRRMGETETQLRVSLAEFKQMLFSASDRRAERGNQ